MPVQLLREAHALMMQQLRLSEKADGDPYELQRLHNYDIRYFIAQRRFWRAIKQFPAEDFQTPLHPQM
jgi:hypothetical protein